MHAHYNVIFVILYLILQIHTSDDGWNWKLEIDYIPSKIVIFPQ